MKFRTVFHIVSVILLFMAMAMVPAAVLAVVDGTPDATGLILSSLGTLLLGGLGFFFTRKRPEARWLSHRDGYLATVLGWLGACMVGAFPFFLYAHLLHADPAWIPEAADATIQVCDLPEDRLHPGREFCSFTDSFFESVSGFTTTGASVIRAGLWDGLDDPTNGGKPGLPRGLLLWRSLIQWLGGMGILVLAVTVLSLIGLGGKHLMAAEVPGLAPGRLSPRIADTARILWRVYAIISLAEVAALMAGGMDLYNAVCHTCTTMATGGFSTLAASVGGMSPYAQWVIIIFMLLAGANFALHWYLLFRRGFQYHRDSEFRVYFLLFVLGTITILLSLRGASLGGAPESVLRHSAFQVISILTTTGYATRDFGSWPFYTQMLLLTLMFVGGCAGSTGGGMKVVRIQVMAKAANRELLRLAHPRAVAAIRVGRVVVKEPMVQAIIGVVAFFVSVFVLSTIFMAAMGLDLVTAASSVAACIGNVGPGLGKVGPAANYYFIPDAGKWLLSLNMLAGRLEIYTVLVLFSPHFWRR